MKSTVDTCKKRLSDGLCLLSRLTCDTEKSEDGCRDSYSVSVTLFKSGHISDSATARDITSLKEEADRIFSLVSEGKVTPMCLREVISDLLSE